jgi:hypothetical protein
LKCRSSAKYRGGCALEGDGTLYFAPEIKALIDARAVAPEINYAALPDYLANHAPSGEETLFSDFKCLLPGHMLTWRDGRIEIRTDWDLSFAQNGHPAISDRGAIVRIRKEHPRIERKLNELVRSAPGAARALQAFELGTLEDISQLLEPRIMQRALPGDRHVGFGE